MSDEPVDDRTARNFAWVMLGAAAPCAVALLRRGAPLSLALTPAVVGLALVAIARAAPRSLVGVYRAWMALGEALGRITTPALLFVVFAVVLIPTRLLLALARRDPLTRRFDRGATTYWSERDHKAFGREGFERLW